ncbi:hypothetical protein BPOR_0155g00030 [Botrytis porri]|uniref:Uncharacterized protein n=1 Tax=Botrytis porri TaxID=87229 RepID=A0A4Z1KVJ3_9HELO|nr:hypothetical protein BPOR_0155g00030 [Botrytis porri]
MRDLKIAWTAAEILNIPKPVAVTVPLFLQDTTSVFLTRMAIDIRPHTLQILRKACPWKEQYTANFDVLCPHILASCRHTKGKAEEKKQGVETDNTKKSFFKM